MLSDGGRVVAGRLQKAGQRRGERPVPPDAASRTRDFASVEYYAPPNQQQMKSRLSGAEAQPLPGGLLVIRQFKLETFTTNGSPQAVVEAPECIYDTLHNTANSAGHLQLRSGDGKIRTEGDGFLWRRSDNSLTISNNVHTVIKTSVWKTDHAMKIFFISAACRKLRPPVGADKSHPCQDHRIRKLVFVPTIFITTRMRGNWLITVTSWRPIGREN